LKLEEITFETKGFQLGFLSKKKKSKVFPIFLFERERKGLNKNFFSEFFFLFFLTEIRRIRLEKIFA